MVHPGGDRERYDGMLRAQFCRGQELNDPEFRNCCVSWMIRCAKEKDQMDETCDKAILYFDAFGRSCATGHGLRSIRGSIRAELHGVLPGYSEEQKCEAVMLACLILASKNIECRARGLWCDSFESTHTQKSLHTGELSVLRRLGWSLHLPSVMEFQHYWLRKCPGHGDVPESNRNNLCAGLVPLAVWVDNRFYGVPPSTLGAAVVRLALQGTRTPAHLDSEFATHGVSLEQLCDLSAKLKGCVPGRAAKSPLCVESLHLAPPDTQPRQDRTRVGGRHLECPLECNLECHLECNLECHGAGRGAARRRLV